MKLEWNPRASQWKAVEGFRFEVLHLDRKQVGSIKVPKKLIKWVINWVAPDAIKTQIGKIVPVELGRMLMSTRQSAALEADVRACSRAMRTLHRCSREMYGSCTALLFAVQGHERASVGLGCAV